MKQKTRRRKERIAMNKARHGLQKRSGQSGDTKKDGELDVRQNRGDAEAKAS
ncbi:MAG: hypothetical protein ABSF36_04140 [Candidatus Methanomethylicaceae archaeon]